MFGQGEVNRIFSMQDTIGSLYFRLGKHTRTHTSKFKFDFKAILREHHTSVVEGMMYESHNKQVNWV